MMPGIIAAAIAFTWWGGFPIYLKWLKDVPPLEILSHRVLWSVLFLAAILGFKRQWAWLAHIRQQPKIALMFFASAAMLGANWVIFIWSVNADRIVDASLGYFMTPLFNVLMGIQLGERLRLWQWASVGLAACGVAWLTLNAGQLPWIGLLLAITFALYGLLRKTAALGSLEGLTIETLAMLPLAALFLCLPDSGSSHAFGTQTSTTLLLLAAGPVTAIPLLLFAYGARRIPLSVVGMLQYIGPSLQLAIGVWVYQEAFGMGRAIGYGLIWTALALYTVESLWRSRGALAPQK
jgi:chloramphenicol-sensitive protein RarD